MKKIIFILVVILLLPIKVEGASIVSRKKVDNVYFNKIVDGVSHQEQYYILKNLSQFVFFLSPTNLNRKPIYDTTYNLDDINLIINDIKRLEIIGYLGQNLCDTSQYYYMATQELIWNYMRYFDFWWSNEQNEKIDLEEYKKEILDMTNEYLIVPDFNIEGDYFIGNTYSFIDKYNVLNKYELINNSDNIKIDDNKLIVNIKENNEFILSKNYKSTNVLKFFFAEGYENLITFLKEPEITCSYDIKGIKKEENNIQNEEINKENESVSGDDNLIEEEEKLEESINNSNEILEELPNTSVSNSFCLLFIILFGVLYILYEK